MSKLLLGLCIGFAYALAAPNSGMADEAPLWKRVAGWDIRVDNTLGYGCFALAIYEEGTVFRIGFDPSRNYSGYIVLGDQAWESIEVDKDYPLVFKFDDETPWNATATGVRFGSGEITFLHASFDKGDFLREFARKHQLEVSFKDRVIARLNLKGSARATKEMLNCQVAMKETGTSKPARDPFSETGKKRDPFSY